MEVIVWMDWMRIDLLFSEKNQNEAASFHQSRGVVQVPRPFTNLSDKFAF